MPVSDFRWIALVTLGGILIVLGVLARDPLKKRDGFLKGGACLALGVGFSVDNLIVARACGALALACFGTWVYLQSRRGDTGKSQSEESTTAES